MAYEDGTFTSVKPYTGKRVSWPFIETTAQDSYAKNTMRDYVIATNSFTPTTADRSSITNLVTYSEQFDNAAWTKTSATVTANSVANPMDGTVSADSLLEAAASAEHTITNTATLAASAAVCSVCAKGISRDWVRLKVTDSAATITTAFFNLSTGVTGTLSGCTAAITQVYPGWHRIEIRIASPAAGAATVSIQPSTDGTTVSYLGEVNKGLYLFGAQVQNAATAGAYASTTNATRSITAPPTDQSQNSSDSFSDPFAYLVAESSPQRFGNGLYQQATRPYARIPGQQINYPGSRYFQMPAVPNDYGNVTSLPATDWASAIGIGDGTFSVSSRAIFVPQTSSLYGLTLPTTLRKIGYASAGTFTLTFGANTTGSLNWNDSAATIAAAINGLASIISAGLTATCINSLNSTSGGFLSIGWGLGTTTATQVTMTSSLTKTTTGDPTTFFTGVGTSAAGQQILLPDNYTITGHAFNDSLALAVVRSDNTIAVYSAAYWDDVDANTIWIPTSAGISGVYFGTYATSYTPGRSVLLRTRLTEDFFLPGVSVGITTAADIPISQGLQNAPDFISAVMTQTGWQTYETEGPSFWMNGPIYRRGYTAINLDDF